MNDARRSFCSNCGEEFAAVPAAGADGVDESTRDVGAGGGLPGWVTRGALAVVAAAALYVVVSAVMQATDDSGEPVSSLATEDTSEATDGATAGTEAPGEPTLLPASDINAGASSVLPPSGGSTYEPENVLDGDLATAWNDGSAGSGVGERLTFDFFEPVEIVRIGVVNGYAKNPDVFSQNARIRQARVITDAGTTEVELADVMTPQSLEGPFGTTGSLTLEVVSVYPGTRYEDLAVTEIGFWVTPSSDEDG